jgi:CubicO group peptidase (beta-lactamase class C family)
MRISKSELQRSLDESIARHKVAGASVAVFYDEKLVTAAAGVINVNTGVEFTPDTLVQLGSITKVFTTTLVMQLVDEGRVDLDERVVRYLPDLKLKDRDALEQITVKMLLNHTAGIDGDLMPDQGHDEETIEKAIARFAQCGQIFRPGADLSYSNAGLVIAGYLVQRLRGKSWYRLIRERIFEPLQMEHAATLPEEALLHRASVGHYLNPVTKKLTLPPSAFLPLSYGPSSTTLMTSAADLITFARTHMALGVAPNGARILSETSAKEMQRTTVNNKGKGYTYIDIGLGWMVSDDGMLHHLGGSPGILSALYAYPQHGFAAAILTNSAHSFGLMDELMEPWLKEFGSRKPIGMVDIQFPGGLEVESNRYVGIYEDIVNRFEVSKTPDGLALSRLAKIAYYENVPAKPTRPARLIPLGGEQFFLESVENDDGSMPDLFRIVAFRNPDAAGRMAHLGNCFRLHPRVSQ